MSQPCVFCSIVAGAAPASVVHRDEVCTAFLDVRPVNAGHLLVVPNDHATHLADMPPATTGHVFRTAQRLADALRASGLPCDGINVLLSDGRPAGQEVMHVHVHVIPRVVGDAFGFRFGRGGSAPPSREGLDRVAHRVRSQL